MKKQTIKTKKKAATPTDSHSKIDMSSAAVTARLKYASQLTSLCISLGKAKFVRDEAKQVKP